MCVASNNTHAYARTHVVSHNRRCASSCLRAYRRNSLRFKWFVKELWKFPGACVTRFACGIPSASSLGWVVEGDAGGRAAVYLTGNPIRNTLKHTRTHENNLKRFHTHIYFSNHNAELTRLTCFLFLVNGASDALNTRIQAERVVRDLLRGCNLILRSECNFAAVKLFICVCIPPTITGAEQERLCTKLAYENKNPATACFASSRASSGTKHCRHERERVEGYRKMYHYKNECNTLL